VGRKDVGQEPFVELVVEAVLGLDGLPEGSLEPCCGDLRRQVVIFLEQT
jgi:hypothetical protein